MFSSPNSFVDRTDQCLQLEVHHVSSKLAGGAISKERLHGI